MNRKNIENLVPVVNRLLDLQSLELINNIQKIREVLYSSVRDNFTKGKQILCSTLDKHPDGHLDLEYRTAFWIYQNPVFTIEWSKKGFDILVDEKISEKQLAEVFSFIQDKFNL